MSSVLSKKLVRQLKRLNAESLGILILLALHYLKRLRAYEQVFENWPVVVLTELRDGERIPVKVNRVSTYLGKELLVYLMSVKYTGNLRNLKLNRSTTLINGDLFENDDCNPISTALSNRGWITKDSCIEKDGIKFSAHTNLAALYETFELEQYPIPVKGREVVDIGANTGDSCIYFIAKGAKKVIALEPLPNVYQVAVKNVELNGLTSRIDLNMAAIGVKGGVIDVPGDVSIPQSGGFSTMKSGGNVVVPVLTIREILSKLEDPYLLKIDCEGCEYDLLEHCYDDVKRFEELVLEVHPGITMKSASKIFKILKRDYELQVMPVAGERYVIGIVHARKRRARRESDHSRDLLPLDTI